ncbi:MAG: ric [Bacillales bacterium]|jgi:regulator of cell morphogenesis and NO signaling|nr:ric [Bacillales bacterium]
MSRTAPKQGDKMMLFTTETKTGDIVTKFPSSSKIFKANKIDFCCGGNRPIGEVLLEKNLPTSILDEINALYEKSQNDPVTEWEQYSASEIIDIILERYHVPTYELLDELTFYVNKVARVHGPHQPHLLEMQDVFSQMKEEMGVHFKKEEMMLFPQMKKYEQTNAPDDLATLGMMISQMEVDHDEVGNMLSKLREITSEYQVPEDGCNTYQLTYLKLEELESLTFDHVHTENNILFRRFQF